MDDDRDIMNDSCGMALRCCTVFFSLNIFADNLCRIPLFFHINNLFPIPIWNHSKEKKELFI